MTREFLDFSLAVGNDLSTPSWSRLSRALPGDRWCLCASWWRRAYEAGVAPPVVLEATHEETLAMLPLALLKSFAVDAVP